MSVPSSLHARVYLRRFLAPLRTELVLDHRSALVPEHPQCCLVLLEDKHRNTVGDGILLAEDSAGLAYSQSGEGVRLAVESGLLAADMIFAARGEYTQTILNPYNNLLASQFGKVHDDWLVAIGRRIPAYLVNSFAKLLLVSPWFSRHVILDQWFLHRSIQRRSAIQTNSLSTSRWKGRSSSSAPRRTILGQSGFTISERPMATRSNSLRSIRSSRSSMPVIEAVSELPNDVVNSWLSVTEPTVMVGFPVNFLVQPARFRGLPSNSGSQKRRCEQWKMSTPAADKGAKNCSSS